MDILLGVLLGILLYAVICLIIAFIRALFAKPEKRKESFGKTFWTFFSTTLNPINWI